MTIGDRLLLINAVSVLLALALFATPATPQTMFASKFTMICSIDYNCVVQKAVPLHQSQEVADYLIQKIHVGEVCRPRFHHLLLPDFLRSEAFHHAPCHGVIYSIPATPHFGRRNAIGPVSLEVTPGSS